MNAMASHAHSGMFKLSSSCVLVVDNDADSADLYATWLLEAGHRCHDLLFDLATPWAANVGTVGC